VLGAALVEEILDHPALDRDLPFELRVGLLEVGELGEQPLTPPMKTSSTTATRTIPWTRALVTVPTAALTRLFCS
jgi:hypothetical protein